MTVNAAAPVCVRESAVGNGLNGFVPGGGDAVGLAVGVAVGATVGGAVGPAGGSVGAAGAAANGVVEAGASHALRAKQTAARSSFLMDLSLSAGRSHSVPVRDGPWKQASQR